VAFALPFFFFFFFFFCGEEEYEKISCWPLGIKAIHQA